MTDRRDHDSEADLTVLRAPTGSGQGSALETPRLLKQRFVLEEKLGAGGMGTVYRARDLRKVEAQDRNPYLAVKVLNNDFRSHPEAFIALQREASKCQSLAHPNIVSIYDFDKDGDLPFMTMELLEGRELAELLRDYPNGLPENLAWPIIRDICAALQRAHEAGIAHADFKPGNVFVLHDGRAKILDFGIARAAQVSRHGDEETLFDPGRFAALTPAYASAEMLRGEQPEPADDIYGLGVVVYLILTGRHPYLRVRADEAQAQGARPKRIRQLNRRQWRMLESMLAFSRAERPLDMNRVMQGLLPRQSISPWAAGSIAAGLVLAAGLLWINMTGSADQAQVERDLMTSLQLRRIDELLEQPALDLAWEQRVAEEMQRLSALDGADAALQGVRTRIHQVYLAALAEEEDFEQAFTLLESAQRFGRSDELSEGHQQLSRRVLSALQALLRVAVDTPSEAGREWLVDVESRLDQFALVSDSPQRKALYAQASGEAYLQAADHAIRQGELALGAELLEAAQPRVFDLALIEPRQDALSQQRRQRDAQDAAARRRAQQAQLERELAQFAQMSCQRMDAQAASRLYTQLSERYPWGREQIRGGIDQAVADCVRRLAELDQDRALALQQSALRAMGELPLVSELRFDPCAMRYLIGNGNQPGRSGFCVDSFSSGQSGPRLVVIPEAENGRFAMTRYAVSWRELAPFCTDTGACVLGGDPGFPVTGISLQTAQAYADWLSQQTGFRYRLPTLREWRQAAEAGEPDPNRNCQVQLTGVSRGAGLVPASAGAGNDFGLVNLLGNVQEWVEDHGRVRAAGGAFTDPLSRCDAGFTRDHDGRPDAQTGFRLVREIP